VLGALEAFGSLIYKVNTGDQAEMYIRTTEKLTEYVLMTYGRGMRNFVKYGKEKEFTEPEFPSASLCSADKLHEAKYKEELSKYHRDKGTRVNSMRSTRLLCLVSLWVNARLWSRTT
jgi:hypothetical protein